MSLDDFLWDCALLSQDSSRLDIIPDYEDDMRHFCVDNQCYSNIGATFQLVPTNDHSAKRGIRVCITESRGNGVLDIIGGELWEGALLLCVYILQHQQIFVRPDVLELGSGVGLPGLLLAQLKANNMKLLKYDVGSITLTDNDPRVVSNLNSSVVSLPACSARKTEVYTGEAEPHEQPNRSVTLHTRLLDWSVFSTRTDTESEGSKTLPKPPDVAQEVASMCEVIMGCELCYAPYHAQCLAQLLRYYLQEGYCHKVVICQMRDREGFQQLLTTLKALSIEYVIQEVTEQQYQLAQRIQCSKATTGKVFTQKDHSVGTTCVVKAPIQTHAEEEDDVVSKTFTFPAELLYDVSGNIDTMDIEKSTSPDSSYTDNLMHSPKEDFVFLIIG